MSKTFAQFLKESVPPQLPTVMQTDGADNVSIITTVSHWLRANRKTIDPKRAIYVKVDGINKWLSSPQSLRKYIVSIRAGENCRVFANAGGGITVDFEDV